MKLAALLTLLALPLHAQTLPGFDRFDLLAAHRARPVAASVWYPAGSPSYRAPLGDGPIFAPSMVLMAPAVAEGRHPLISFARSGGTMPWRAGCGAGGQGVSFWRSIIPAPPRATAHPPLADLDAAPRSGRSFAMFSRPRFRAHIDAKRIAAIGFSLGGTTAWPCGIRFDGNVQAQNCATGRGRRLRLSPVPVQISPPPKASVPTQPAKVASAVAIDRLWRFCHPRKPCRRQHPVHLINLGADRLAAVDISPTDNNLAARLPGAAPSPPPPLQLPRALQTGCRGAAGEGEDPICTDPRGLTG